MDPSKVADTNTGYECEFVEKPKEVEYECSICALILRDPQSTTCCGNSFCRGCIERSKVISPLCPLCKQHFETHPNKWLQRKLNQLEVYCIHKKDGCKWVGPLGRLDEHLNRNADMDKLIEGCGFVFLKCSDCNASIPRNDYGVHVSIDCEQRPFSCDHCGEYSSTYADVINNHWRKCPCHPVECVNRCGAHPKRKHLNHHLSNECRLTSISCGDCSAQVLRGEMHKHLSFHEKLSRLAIDETEQEIHKLRAENQYLQGVVENLHLRTSKNEEEIRRLRQDNLEIQTEIRQQNYELTRSHEDLRKVCESLKQEYELIHGKATQLSDDLTQFKLAEIERQKFASSETYRYSPKNFGQDPDQIATTYYDDDLELSQAPATGHSQDFEIPDHQQDPLILGPPVKIIMLNYTAYSSGRKSGKFWMSKPFYSGLQPSYKLCLSVQASREPMSVHVRLMRGKFDDQLNWPFNADITIKLINQGRGRDKIRTVLFRNGRRVTEGNVARGGRGADFIPLYEKSSFVKDDALWFEVVDVQLI